MLTAIVNLLLVLLALAARPSAATSLTPEAALELVRTNSRPSSYNRTLARLSQILARADIADHLGRVAAGPCGGGTDGGRPVIVDDDSNQPLNDLVHDAQLADCSPSGQNSPTPPLFVLIVPSEATHAAAARRSIVRRTWGSRRGVALVFFLGGATSSDAQAVVDAEYRQYRDLVQFRKTDSPAWLTGRHLATLEWALTRCRGARHIVRVEDRVFVDTPHLSAYLSESPPQGILCRVRRNETPQRSSIYQWYLSEKEFPGKRYPDFCSTMAYVMSNDTALRLLVCAALKPPVWIDDVHVTGILREAADVPLTQFRAGHGFGRFLPSDSRSWSSASDFMFLDSDRPEFIEVYWPGLWRSLLLRECSKMIF